MPVNGGVDRLSARRGPSLPPGLRGSIVIDPNQFRRVANTEPLPIYEPKDNPSVLPPLEQMPGGNLDMAARSVRLSEDNSLMNRVEISSVTRVASSLVFVTCLFSLVTYFLTGFIVIHPFLSILVATAAVVFYGMGEMMRRAVAR
jgi:hypothetical protein